MVNYSPIKDEDVRRMIRHLAALAEHPKAAASKYCLRSRARRAGVLSGTRSSMAKWTGMSRDLD